MASTLRSSALALTFSPSPRLFFQPDLVNAPLLTDKQKLRALNEFGMGAAYFQHFDQSLSLMSHHTYFKDILIAKLRSHALIVGYDFSFGHKRLGDLNYLTKVCGEKEIPLEIMKPLTDSQEIISSSLVRKSLVDTGDLDRAAALLGRPYLLEGVIGAGAQLGRKLGFPTANLGEVQQLLPKTGVYCGWVFVPPSESSEIPILTVPHESYPAVINVGLRPTVHDGASEVKVEANLLDQKLPHDALYDKKVGFYFSSRIRDEVRFNSLEDLQSQIAKDVVLCKQKHF